MLDRFEIHPDYRHALEAAGLADFETIMACEQVQWIGRHARRDVARLEISLGAERRHLFLKRDRRPRFKDLFVSFLHGWGWATKALWEWRAIHCLRAAGFGCAEPVAVGQRGLFRPKGFLILAELPDATPLSEALRQISPVDRRLLITALAREVARLHDAGFDHPDLYSKHVWVARRGGAWQVFLLDLQRTLPRRVVFWRHRLRDLAALNSTVVHDAASSLDRLRFLRHYWQSTRRPGQLRRAAARLARRTKKLLARPAIARRQSFAPLMSQQRARLQVTADGRMWFDRAHGELFRRHGLDRFEAVMRSDQGTLLLRRPDGENRRLAWRDGGDGRSSAAYLKCHRSRAVTDRLRAWLNRPPGRTPGGVEAENLLDLERAGVKTPPLLAYGQSLSRKGTLESFVLTEEVADAVPLDTLLRQRFSNGTAPAHRDRRLSRLIDVVADTARRFHALGYHHGEFCCCHFLVTEPAAGSFRVHLIDFERARYRRYGRRRGMVKDLAQLSDSAPAEIVCPRVRLAFLKRYFGLSRLGLHEKQLVRRILAEQRRITRRGSPS